MAVYAHRGARTEPQYGIEGSSTNTRYSYSKPTEKSQPGLPDWEGEKTSKIDSYTLPIIDVQTAKRNFPGYTESQPYSLEEMQRGDISGATDTDAVTHRMEGKNTGGGYTKIYQKSGPKEHVPIKSTSRR